MFLHNVITPLCLALLISVLSPLTEVGFSRWVDRSSGQQADKHSQTPISITIKLEKAPKLNEKVKIICEVRSVLDAPGTVARIELPSGAKRVTGKLEWIGKLKKDGPITFTAMIKFVAEGNWIIRARAVRRIDDDNTWGDLDTIYLNVTKKEGRFGFLYSSSKPCTIKEENRSRPLLTPRVSAMGLV